MNRVFRILISIVGALVVTLLLCALPNFLSNDSVHEKSKPVSAIKIANILPPQIEKKQKKVKQIKKIKTVKQRKINRSVKQQVTPLSVDLKPIPFSIPAAGLPDMAKVSVPSTLGLSGAMRLSEVDKGPKLSRYVPPVYPPKARGKRIEGKIMVRCVVNEKGVITGAEILSSEPKGYFEKAALKAVKKWRFTPAKYQNKAVSVYVDIPLNFSLN